MELGYDKVRQPLRDLATERVKSSRSTNQNCPFGRLSTQCRSLAKHFVIPRIGGFVIPRIGGFVTLRIGGFVIPRIGG